MIEKIEWVWNQPCVFGAPGELVVTITASDADTDVSELTYADSGISPGECTSINDAVTTLTCGDWPGLRGTDAIVTDPQGNEGRLFFGFDPCVDGCEGDACP